MVRRRSSLSLKEPLEANPRLIPPLQRWIHWYRLFAGILDINFQVILHILADTWQIMHHIYAQLAELPGITNSRKLQQLGWVNGAGTANDLTTIRFLRAAVSADILDSHCLLSFKQDPVGESTTDNGQIGSSHHGMQISPGRTQAAAAMNVAVKGAKSLLLVPIDILCQRIACLLHCPHEGAKERIFTGASF